MREAVMHLSGYRYQGTYGISYRVKERITMSDFSFRVQHVTKTEIDVTHAQPSRNGVDTLTGAASFLDPARNRVWHARGGRLPDSCHCDRDRHETRALGNLPINGRTIINSDQILEIRQTPRTLIVLGGGVIGVEYASMFATLGVRVILIEKQARLLEFADSGIVEALCYHLRDMRVTPRLNEEVESVEETPEGGVVASLKSKKKISGDMLLCTIGRQGNIEDLNLEAAGLEARPDCRL